MVLCACATHSMKMALLGRVFLCIRYPWLEVSIATVIPTRVEHTPLLFVSVLRVFRSAI